MAQMAEAAFERIKNHPGVIGVIIVNSQGYPYKTSMDNPTTMRYVESLGGAIYSAKNLVRDLDPENHMDYLRISAERETSSQDLTTGARKKQIKTTEVMISPAEEYTIVVIQEIVKNDRKDKRKLPLYDNFM